MFNLVRTTNEQSAVGRTTKSKFVRVFVVVVYFSANNKTISLLLNTPLKVKFFDVYMMLFCCQRTSFLKFCVHLANKGYAQIFV